MLGPYGEMLFLEAFPGRRGPPVQDEISGSQCVDVSIFKHSHHHHYNSSKTLRDIDLPYRSLVVSVGNGLHPPF